MKWRLDWFWSFGRKEGESWYSGVEKMRRNLELTERSLIWRRRNCWSQWGMRFKSGFGLGKVGGMKEAWFW